jgi:arylsulfatase A-like enzyme
LLQTSRYTSHQLLHITDWLPTLLHAAAGEDAVHRLPPDVDGVDQWNVLSDNEAPVRKEILLNIDPIERSRAVRVDDMKLLMAESGYTRSCAGWYPTDNTTSNDTLPYPCSSDHVSSDIYENAADQYYRIDDGGEYDRIAALEPLRSSLFWKMAQPTYRIKSQTGQMNDHGDGRGQQLPGRRSTVPDVSYWRQNGRMHSDLAYVLDKFSDGNAVLGSPLVVDCGPQPKNASANCRPWQAPCLYNVTADPCEYHNLAAAQPDIVKLLRDRLFEYEKSAKRPLNKPVDDAGLPYHHNWTWVPWIKHDNVHLIV